MRRVMLIIMTIISSMLVGCEMSDKDAVRSAWYAKHEKTSPNPTKITQIAKANPPKDLVAQYNPKCVYCLSYTSEYTNDIKEKKLYKSGNIAIISQSGSINFLEYWDLLSSDEERTAAVEALLDGKTKLDPTEQRIEKFRRLWENTCPFPWILQEFETRTADGPQKKTNEGASDAKVVVVKQQATHIKAVNFDWAPVKKEVVPASVLYLEVVIQNVGNADARDIEVGADCHSTEGWQCDKDGSLNRSFNRRESTVDYLAKGSKETCTVLIAWVHRIDDYGSAITMRVAHSYPVPAISAKILKFSTVK